MLRIVLYLLQHRQNNNSNNTMNNEHPLYHRPHQCAIVITIIIIINNNTRIIMKINEQGFLEKIVDNFFGSLKRGVSDRYIAAAKKAGLDDDTIKTKKKSTCFIAF